MFQIVEESVKKYRICIMRAPDAEEESVLAHCLVTEEGAIKNIVPFDKWFHFIDGSPGHNKNTIVIAVESNGELTELQYSVLKEIIEEVRSLSYCNIEPIVYDDKEKHKINKILQLSGILFGASYSKEALEFDNLDLTKFI